MKRAAQSAHAFAWCRVFFGFYLCLHFLWLFPDAVELFSSAGMLPDASLLPTFGTLPNLFWISDAPWMVYLTLSSGVVLSLLLMVGLGRRGVSFGLWLIWMSLLNRNLFISNPSLPFVGLLLLVLTVLPKGEPTLRSSGEPGWVLPHSVHLALLMTLMAGYTVSGCHKLFSPSWVDGQALRYVLTLPLARDHGLRTFLLDAPPFWLEAATYLTLAMEVSALPLALFRPTRPWVFAGLTVMNLGILCLVDFADLTFGILLFHLFCIDEKWIPPAQSQVEHPIYVFDGVCGLCNGVVDFTLRTDPYSRIHFASIQGEKVKALEVPMVHNGETMAVWEGDQVRTQSDAALRLAALLGGFWRVLAAVGQLCPRPLRNRVYHVVQRHRYGWFGKHETCRIPTPAERERFFD